MATPTLTALMTLVDDFNNNSPGNVGATHANAAANETDIHHMGSGCAATGYSGNPPTNPTPIQSEISAAGVTVPSFASANKHLGIWLRCLYPVFDAARLGVGIFLSNDTGNRFYFNGTGDDEGYSGGWHFHVQTINTSGGGATPDYAPIITSGSPNITNITIVGFAFDIRVSKGEDFLQNQYMDVCRITDGNGDFGLRYTGGTTGDRLFFTDLTDADDSTTRYGILQPEGVGFSLSGELHFGLATSTIYIQDLNKTINCRDLPVAAGADNFFKIIGVDGTTGVTNIDLQGFTWQGVVGKEFEFNMSALGAGDAGNFDSSRFISGGTLTFGAQSTVDGATFALCITVVPNGITVNDPTFINSKAVTLTNASDEIIGGQTILHDTLTSVAFVTTDDFDKITGHDFDNTAGVGWAVDLGVIAATRADDCDANSFTGYSTTVNGNKAVKVHVNTGVTYTINVVNGGNLATNLVYNSGPGTLIVQNAVTIQVTVLDDTTGLGILDARVQLYLTSDYSTSVLNGGTNASGIVSDSYAYAGDAGVEGWARQFDISGTDYIQKNISGTITTNGFFLTVRLEPQT